MAQRYFHTEPMFVTHQTDTGLRICYQDPREVGADRLVNAVAVLEKDGGPRVGGGPGPALTLPGGAAGARDMGGVLPAGHGLPIAPPYCRAAPPPRVDISRPR